MTPSSCPLLTTRVLTRSSSTSVFHSVIPSASPSPPSRSTQRVIQTAHSHIQNRATPRLGTRSLWSPNSAWPQVLPVTRHFALPSPLTAMALKVYIIFSQDTQLMSPILAAQANGSHDMEIHSTLIPRPYLEDE